MPSQLSRLIEPGLASLINGSKGQALDTRDQVRRLSGSSTLANESGIHQGGNDQAKRFKRIADLGAAHRPGSTMGRWCHPRMAPPFFDAAKPAEVGGPSALKCKTARQPHAHLTTQVGGGEGSNPPARRRLRGHNQRKSDAGARSGTDSTEATQRAFS